MRVASIEASGVDVGSRGGAMSDIPVAMPITTPIPTCSAIQVRAGNKGSIRCRTAPTRTPFTAPENAASAIHAT